MRSWHLVLCVVIVGCVVVGCGDGPTQPNRSPGTPTPNRPQATPTPALGVNGTWTGTISFGTDYIKPCPAHESIQVALSQIGNEFTGSLQTACEGVLALHGTFTSTSLVTVDLLKANEASIGVLKGSATQSRIYAENRDGAPWDYGDPTIGLDLSR